MATHTLGTTATTSLVAVTWSPSPQVLLPADLTTIHSNMRDDKSAINMSLAGNHPVTYLGRLYVPNRGWLTILPGDVIAVDSVANSGWPILLSANAIAHGPWTFV